MVLMLFLGILDVLFAGCMVLTQMGVLHSWRLALMGAFFWVAKGAIFRGSFLSVVDVVAGIYFIFVMLGVSSPITYLFLGIMVYKFVVSLVLRG
jgi:hypothetical protein